MGTDAVVTEAAGDDPAGEAPARATLWVIVASATLTVMAGAILGPVVPDIRDGLGVSGSLAGLIITTHGAFIVLASPLAGRLIDRYGPRRPYVLGLGLYALGGGAGLVVDSFLPLLASRAVLGVGVAFVYTGVTVLIYDLYRGRQMDRALGLRSGANSVGAAVWPLVGGALGVVSWQSPFAVYLVAAPLGLVALVAIPETARGTDTDGDGSDAGDGDDGGTDATDALAVIRERPALAAVYLLYFGANALLYAIVVFYPQLLGGLGVETAFGVGLYLSANGIAGGATGAYYDRFKRRFGARRLVLAALVLWAVGLGTAVVVASPAAAFAPVILFGLGIGFVFPSTFVWVESLAPEALQGQLGSYVAMAGYVGQFVSPLLFGAFVGPFGIRGPFVVAALAAGGGAVALALAGRR